MLRSPLRRQYFIAASMLFLTQLPLPALAGFRVCNQTLDVVNIAVGNWDHDGWETSGWWVAGPNQCAEVIEADLSARYVYVYAQDVFRNPMFDGDTIMCVDAAEFRIRGKEDCLQRGKIAARFREVDTQNAKAWTFNIVTLAQ
ncbi:putative integral membrane protein [Tritonibacter multivorans]|uniref:Putative integral membrane protein n=1 Tax=Tritonibacter multivorans TaxID=928856 RepID=A0A0P1G0J8_9RHOB|nr:DUF1036 domain-containing protein [Tritonibacter multivorans]MDA7423017.1 DUF1036 domain-containing protein [Tritonibacter multivorans]CUH75056.1 putative integral membrane protein [Tritonibacter multivorans]SFD77570.1 Uncharacterized membrane protein [Tritonibacter multivorans]